MLHFDSKNHLKPYEPISSTVAELKAVFVDAIPFSTTRLSHFNNYLRYSDDLKQLLGGIYFKQWINGSFISKKMHPKDIDLVTFIDHSIINTLGNKLDNFRADGSWSVYGVDAYIIEMYPKNSELYNRYTNSDIIEWYNLFTHTRLNKNDKKDLKGFLEINY